MFMSILWDTIFEINDTYADAGIFLIGDGIPALKFGAADNPVVFAAGFGADEWQTGVLALRFFERLLFNKERGLNISGIATRRAFKKRSVVIIPTVCPAKMRAEGDKPGKNDLKAIEKYLRFNKANMLITLEKEGSFVFSPKANSSLKADTETMSKIICACSGLALTTENESAAASLCEWASKENSLPAFSLAPKSLKASEIESTYRSLEETFAVMALI